MYIIGKKVKDGVKCRVVQGNDGETHLINETLLKDMMQKGTVVVENAELKGNRLYVKTLGNIPKKQIGYPRSTELSKLSKEEKAKYCFDVLVQQKSTIDMSIFTVDELDCILEGGWHLEILDHGNSTVDLRLSQNLYYYTFIGAVVKESIRRGYLTEDENKQYLLGTNNKGRICNQMSYTEWILKHKKRG